MELSDHYTPQSFAALVERETDDLELKSGIGRDPLQEVMVAFSNGTGGVIMIGVTDQRHVKGQRLDQGTEDKIHQAASTAHNLGRYRIRQLTVGDRPVVAVEVHRREEGVAQTSDGRILARRGGRSAPLFGADAWELMSQRALRRFERADTGIGLSTADPVALGELARVHDWPDKDEALRDRLLERGLATRDGTLTVAGALFLTDPARSLELGKAVVEVRRYADNGPDYDRRLAFGGPLQRQVHDATNFVMDELGSDLVVAGLYRYELPRLPQVVVREALANAVAHRSYEVDRSVTLVEMRPDRVVVTSPGRLPEPVTVPTMRQGQAARNPTVIDVLRRFDLAEDAGRGVDVMQDTMQEALLEQPEFTEGSASVTVVLSLRGLITARERGWVADLERRGNLQLSDRLLLVHAARGERLTNSRAREILGVDSTSARFALQRLRDNGLLVQHGERGGVAYTLVETIAPPAAYRMNPRQLEDLVLGEAEQGPLTNERVRETTGLDRMDALALLQSLVSSGRLVRSGQRRGTRYALPDR